MKQLKEYSLITLSYFTVVELNKIISNDDHTEKTKSFARRIVNVKLSH
jgi:hypothetical protein